MDSLVIHVSKSALNFISTHIIIYVNLDNATDRDSQIELDTCHYASAGTYSTHHFLRVLTFKVHTVSVIVLFVFSSLKPTPLVPFQSVNKVVVYKYPYSTMHVLLVISIFEVHKPKSNIV